jgi:hypothetical protein
MSETWKPVAGYEAYRVSTLGRVRGQDGKLFSAKQGKNGYCAVSFRKNGKNKTSLVHRVVAQTFLPNPESKPYVNHLNGKKSDNRLENLAWATSSENALHAHSEGLIKVHKGAAHPNARWGRGEVALMRFLHMEGLTSQHISELFRFTPHGVRRIVNGHRYK